MSTEPSPSIRAVLKLLKAQILKVDQQLLKLIDDCEEYKTIQDIVQSVPGVGPVLTLTLISNLPELGRMTNKQAASLLGVAPINRDSGRHQGKRFIRGGRARVRTVMYMAMMSAIQCNPVFKQHYQQLLAKGKQKKVALIACVRKLIVTLNAMLRDQVYWQQNATPKMLA